MTLRPKFYIMAAAGVAVAALAFGALAQPPKREIRIFHGGGDFATLDANKDGKVTREEFNRPPPDPFDLMDGNKDGSVTEEEFKAFKPPHIERDVVMVRGGPGMDGPDGPPPPGARIHKREIRILGGDGLDADKDGKVTFEEFSAPMKEHFGEMDTNKDGVLSGDELDRHGPPPPPPGR